MQIESGPGGDGRGRRRLLAACLCLCAAAVTGGCRFLADEFTWLDRAAPTSTVAPDAPVSGLAERP